MSNSSKRQSSYALEDLGDSLERELNNKRSPSQETELDISPSSSTTHHERRKPDITTLDRRTKASNRRMRASARRSGATTGRKPSMDNPSAHSDQFPTNDGNDTAFLNENDRSGGSLFVGNTFNGQYFPYGLPNGRPNGPFTLRSDNDTGIPPSTTGGTRQSNTSIPANRTSSAASLNPFFREPDHFSDSSDEWEDDSDNDEIRSSPRNEFHGPVHIGGRNIRNQNFSCGPGETLNFGSNASTNPGTENRGERPFSRRKGLMEASDVSGNTGGYTNSTPTHAASTRDDNRSESSIPLNFNLRTRRATRSDYKADEEGNQIFGADGGNYRF